MGVPVNALAVPMALEDSIAGYEHIETIRKFFPETWIWQLLEVGLVNQLITFYFVLFLACTLVCCTTLQSN